MWPPGPVTPGTEGWGTEWRGLGPQAPLTPGAQGQKRRGGLVLLPLGSGHGAGLLDPLATEGLWGRRPGGLGATSAAPRPGQDAAGPAGPGRTSFSQEGRVGRSSRFSEEVVSPNFYLFIIQILATESDVKNSKIQTPGPTSPLGTCPAATPHWQGPD